MVSVSLRASAELCWLIPLGYLLGAASTGHPEPVISSALVVWIAIFGATGRTLSVIADHPRVTPSTIAVLGVVQVFTFWFLQYRHILTQLPWDLLLLSDDLIPLLSALGYLILVLYRGLSTRPDQRQTYHWNILRSAVLTTIMILAMKYIIGWFPLWPVLWLLPAIVGGGVLQRATFISPSPDAGSLPWASRTVVIAALVTASVLFGLVVTALSSPGFLGLVQEALLQLWLLFARLITYLLYPFIYAFFLLYRLLKPYISGIEADPDMEMPDEPAPPDDSFTQIPPGTDAPSIILRLLVLALLTGAVIYIIRSVSSESQNDDQPSWSEQRESIWDGEDFLRRLSQMFTQKPQTTSFNYRTETEKNIRILYRRLRRQFVSDLEVQPGETPRKQAEHLLDGLTESGHRHLWLLIDAYERVRYGPPIEDEQLVRQTQQAFEALLEERKPAE